MICLFKILSFQHTAQHTVFKQGFAKEVGQKLKRKNNKVDSDECSKEGAQRIYNARKSSDICPTIQCYLMPSDILVSSIWQAGR